MEIIISIGVSLIIQGLKLLFDKVEKQKRVFFINLILFILSFVMAWLYAKAQQEGWWEYFYQITLYASGIHNILLRRME